MQTLIVFLEITKDSYRKEMHFTKIPKTADKPMRH